ncbi:MAG: hypothetical protein GKR94_26075 [Gammaproteobacteria bacterium]|nr:hypothetical protein [Gammaproteobacteria bacterium]
MSDGVANDFAPFIGATLANLATGTLARGHTSSHAQLFVGGAVLYLADYDGIDKTSADALIAAKLKEHFGLDPAGADTVITMLDEPSPQAISFWPKTPAQCGAGSHTMTKTHRSNQYRSN